METKVKITPAVIQQFRESKFSPTLSISQTNMTFNKSAANHLSLKKGSQFTLEIIDGKLYYEDAVKEGFVITNETEKMLNVSAVGIGEYLDTHLHCGTKSLRFDIGEFKEGRRLLTLRTK